MKYMFYFQAQPCEVLNFATGGSDYIITQCILFIPFIASA
jgi:hypothetical protein